MRGVRIFIGRSIKHKTTHTFIKLPSAFKPLLPYCIGIVGAFSAALVHSHISYIPDINITQQIYHYDRVLPQF